MKYFVRLLFLFLVMGTLVPNVVAQDFERTIQLDRFEPDPILNRNAWHVSRSDILHHLEFGAAIQGHYTRDHLVLDIGGESQTLVENKFQGEISLGIGLFDWVDIGVGLPVVFLQDGDYAGFGQEPDENQTRTANVGDLRVVPKIRLLRREWAYGFGAALSGSLYLPIGEQNTFNSDGEVRFTPRLTLDWAHPIGFAVALNIGYAARPSTTVLDFTSTDTLPFGVGLVIPTGWKPMSIVGNLFGDLEASDPQFGGNRSEPVEALGGFHFQVPEGVDFVIAAGAGLNDNVGSPLFRAYVGFGYAPRSRDRDGDGIDDDRDMCPFEKEDIDGDRDSDGCPDGDRDGDGIPDERDSCPNKAEDIDNFEDGDGCPDEDNDNDDILDRKDRCPDVKGSAANDGCPDNDRDGDGITDREDNCPDEAEDRDNHDDADGCPDPDNDFDGVPDATDRCPNTAEDRDGYMDEDGCPDPDNDGDGILDADDRCPNEAENKNDFEDEDGCPDTKQAKVKLSRDKIIIRDKIYFATGSSKIRTVSYDILDEMAKFLKDNGQVKRVRIEGHTDSKGSSTNNQRLSQTRAEAVRTYLVRKGISGDRLEAVGYGEERPVTENSTAEGRERNRRVEFTVVR